MRSARTLLADLEALAAQLPDGAVAFAELHGELSRALDRGDVIATRGAMERASAMLDIAQQHVWAREAQTAIAEYMPKARRLEALYAASRARGLTESEDIEVRTLELECGELTQRAKALAALAVGGDAVAECGPPAEPDGQPNRFWNDTRGAS